MFSDECDKEPEAKSYLIKLNEADSGHTSQSRIQMAQKIIHQRQIQS